MIRLALPKGRNLGPTLAAFRAAGVPLAGLEENGRKLWMELPGEGLSAPGSSDSPEENGSGRLEILILKDKDLPLYVEYGIADLGVVGSDVLEESGAELLVPLRLTDGGSRLSLIGYPGALPAPGDQVRLATKYPRIARRLVAQRPWGAEVVELSGSIELAPMLELAELALDIVQTGQTLRDNGLEELETVADVAPCVVVNRASFQRHRGALNGLLGRMEEAGVAA